MKSIISYKYFACVLLLIAVSNANSAVNYYANGVIDGSTPSSVIHIWNNSVVNMTSGDLVSVDTFNDSVIDVSGGRIHQGLSVWNTSEAVIHGGQVDLFIEAHDSAAINLYGGNCNGWLYAEGTSVVTIDGYGFNYDISAGNKNGGQLTGFWADGTPLSIDFLNDIDHGVISYEHVVLVPEPATLSLLALGGLVLRRK